MSVPTRLRADLRFDRLEDRAVPDAAMLDLTVRGSSGVVNGALFEQFDAQPTGTGHIHSFLRIQGVSAHDVVQHGYNTDARPLQFDENKSPQFTRSLPLGELPLVNVGGALYREFLLDINQKSSQPYQSLDRVQIFLANSPTTSRYDLSTGRLDGKTAVYDTDAGGDHWVKLDYRLNSGSGSGDMLMYVPDALFTGATYVSLYSRFGEHYASNAGFQEWAVGQGSGSVMAPQFGSITGMKFADLNGNGVRDDGEIGLQNWVIYLDANGNGVLDANETYTLTDVNGNYAFNDLLAGSGVGYIVREVQQGGWTQATVDPPAIFLMPGQVVSGVDFGNIPPD